MTRKHSKRKPELPLIAVDRVFRVSITAYYCLLLQITSYFYHYFQFFNYFLLLSLVMGSNRAVMGCIFGKKMSIIPNYFKFFYYPLLLLNTFSTVPLILSIRAVGLNKTCRSFKLTWGAIHIMQQKMQSNMFVPAGIIGNLSSSPLARLEQ